MKEWFQTYVSNTLGATGNQVHFSTEGRVDSGCIFYKVFSGGKYRYSLLFSNIIESTYKPEYRSTANLICDSWQLMGAEIAVCQQPDPKQAKDFQPLTFGGSREKKVMPGEFFVTDPVELDAPKDSYLCLRISYCGDMIPYHLENVLPTFVQRDGAWMEDKRMPVPGMIGCDRRVAARVAFLGDSITQGIGVPHNSYAHWCALVSEAIGERYSYWNLGIGYGRGQDAATDGAWLYKAKQADAVVVAYGSNDVGRGRTLEQMKQDMTTIVEKLKGYGCKVFLISVPPYSWKEEKLQRWEGINRYLVEELSKRADGFLDIAPLLTDPNDPGVALHGNHPDEEGCRIWAQALEPKLRSFLEAM